MDQADEKLSKACTLLAQQVVEHNDKHTADGAALRATVEHNHKELSLRADELGRTQESEAAALAERLGAQEKALDREVRELTTAQTNAAAAHGERLQSLEAKAVEGAEALRAAATRLEQQGAESRQALEGTATANRQKLEADIARQTAEWQAVAAENGDAIRANGEAIRDAREHCNTVIESLTQLTASKTDELESGLAAQKEASVNAVYYNHLTVEFWVWPKCL